ASPTITVQPNHECHPVTQLLLGQPELWGNAKFRLVNKRGIRGRAPIYGVSFGRALVEALRSGRVSSLFWLPPEAYAGRALESRLLVITTRRRSETKALNVESWQCVGDGIEVFYVHMLISQQAVTHIDGATVTFPTSEAAAQLFNRGRKLKGI